MNFQPLSLSRRQCRHCRVVVACVSCVPRVRESHLQIACNRHGAKNTVETLAKVAEKAKRRSTLVYFSSFSYYASLLQMHFTDVKKTQTHIFIFVASLFLPFVSSYFRSSSVLLNLDKFNRDLMKSAPSRRAKGLQASLADALM